MRAEGKLRKTEDEMRRGRGGDGRRKFSGWRVGVTFKLDDGVTGVQSLEGCEGKMMFMLPSDYTRYMFN